jgi:3-phenylpropionate/cinnamic acid dioxygenase small subunit
MDKAIKELIDLRAIEQLMVRYADRIDANDPEGAAACFAEDGIGNYWGKYTGRIEIAARLGKILDRFSATSHHLSNVSIQLDGDRATAMSYVYAFHRMADSNDPMHYWGRWVDRLVRVEEGWRFAEREVVGIGSVEPDDAGRDREQPGHPGRLER